LVTEKNTGVIGASPVTHRASGAGCDAKETGTRLVVGAGGGDVTVVAVASVVEVLGEMSCVEVVVDCGAVSGIHNSSTVINP
jgi:hypothetical protein